MAENNLTNKLQICVGKTIEKIECEPYYETLKINFTDGTSLIINHYYDGLEIFLNKKQLYEFIDVEGGEWREK